VTFGRDPGGQPGNKNARTHGFYEGALPRRAAKILRRAGKLDPHALKEEIALVRTRMYELAELQPENVEVLVLAGRLLVKMMALDYGFGKEQEAGINESLEGLLASLLPKGV
jgi:hypothetical protein